MKLQPLKDRARGPEKPSEPNDAVALMRSILGVVAAVEADTQPGRDQATDDPGALIAAMVIVAHAGSTCQTYIEKASERGWRRLTTFVD